MRNLPVRLVAFSSFLALSTISAACHEIEGGVEIPPIGAIAIGAAPNSALQVRATDCGEDWSGAADCSAVGSDGVEYIFFDGALSKVSAVRGDVDASVTLPSNVKFGDEIHAASAKMVANGVRLKRGVTYDGRIVYTSDFVVRSSAGVCFSIELIADSQGNLVEYVQRTDF